MAQLLKYNFSAMSTGIEFQAYFDCGVVEANTLLQKAEQEFYRVAKTYTRFADNSELSLINRAGGGQLTEEFGRLVELMLELAEFSNGAFDPTVIDLLELNGYKSSFDAAKIIQNRKIPVDIAHYLKKRPSWKQISLSPVSNQTDSRLAPSADNAYQLQLAEGQRLDLGSIGKGYAIGQAAAVLSAGSKRFMINAGGDVYARGGGWTASLEIKNPENRFLQLKLSSVGQAVASSGSWARQAGSFHHLLDTSTGKPTGPVQAFCIGPDPTLADGLATVLCLTGKSYIDLIKEEYGYDSLVVEHGKLYYSDDVPVVN
jgi:thiamine biosynthesis lipoprotein ApbE